MVLLDVVSGTFISPTLNILDYQYLSCVSSFLNGQLSLRSSDDEYSSSLESEDEDIKTSRSSLDLLQHIEDKTIAKKMPGRAQQTAIKIIS